MNKPRFTIKEKSGENIHHQKGKTYYIIYERVPSYPVTLPIALFKSKCHADEYLELKEGN